VDWACLLSYLPLTYHVKGCLKAEPMALKGNLHDFSITQLLNLIHLARKTGTLAIDGKNSATRASFREGKLVFAQTDALDGRLVGMLVRVGGSRWNKARRFRPPRPTVNCLTGCRPVC
jgi:hypothetical protein